MHSEHAKPRHSCPWASPALLSPKPVLLPSQTQPDLSGANPTSAAGAPTAAPRGSPEHLWHHTSSSPIGHTEGSGSHAAHPAVCYWQNWNSLSLTPSSTLHTISNNREEHMPAGQVLIGMGHKTQDQGSKLWAALCHTVTAEHHFRTHHVSSLLLASQFLQSLCQLSLQDKAKRVRGWA